MAGQPANPDLPGILVVDPSKVTLVAARKLLEPHFSVYLAEDVEGAFELVSSIPEISAVFTEQHMPGQTPNALLARIRQSDEERIADLPAIIITSGERKEAERREAMDAGATDFIIKPFDPVDLVTRARAWASTSQNAAQMRQHNSVLRKLVMLDSETRAGNRDYLLQEIVKDRSFTARHGGNHSMLYIIIDNHERIVLEQGRMAAREAIVLVAEAIRSKCRREDTFARVGEGEFALSLLHTGHIGARVLAERIRQAISLKLFKPRGMPIALTVSTGVSMCPVNVDMSAEQVLEAAQKAARQAVRSGGNQTYVAADITARPQSPKISKATTAGDDRQGRSCQFLKNLDVPAALSSPGEFIEELLPILQELGEAERLNLIDRLLVMAESPPDV